MNQWYVLYTFREYGSIFYVNALTLRRATRNMHRPACVLMIFANTVSPNRHQSISNHADFTLIMVPCGLYYVIGMAIKPLNKVCSMEFWRSASRQFLLLGDLSSHGNYNIWLENGSMLATWQVTGIMINCNAYVDDYFVLVTRNGRV